jgi:two-component system OmpR family response regulator
MKLVLLEDDTKLANLLIQSFKEIGFYTDHASNFQDFKKLLKSATQIDFMILDRLIGSEDTKNIIGDIRKDFPSVPIIVLSAISTPNEKTDLINRGVDDYLGKPFSSQELIARIRALLRRTSVPAQNYIQIGNLIIDSTKRIISVESRNELLPAKEFLLLHTLSQEKGRVWNKSDLLDYVWGQMADVETNVVEATIANIRKRLSDIGAHATIKNARNVGYWIED